MPRISRVKLTEAQQQHLFETTICTQYQCAESAKLAKLGLVTLGKSKFCHWAKITPEGEALVMKLDPKFSDRAIKREAKYLEGLTDTRRETRKPQLSANPMSARRLGQNRPRPRRSCGEARKPT
jgi:hypothetical protein